MGLLLARKVLCGQIMAPSPRTVKLNIQIGKLWFVDANIINKSRRIVALWNGKDDRLFYEAAHGGAAILRIAATQAWPGTAWSYLLVLRRGGDSVVPNEVDWIHGTSGQVRHKRTVSRASELTMGLWLWNLRHEKCLGWANRRAQSWSVLTCRADNLPGISTVNPIRAEAPLSIFIVLPPCCSGTQIVARGRFANRPVVHGGAPTHVAGPPRTLY
jgi:hypothetical protein